MTCQLLRKYDDRMFMLSLKRTHMTSEIRHASCQQQYGSVRKRHPTGRVSIGLGPVLLLDVNHDY